MPKTTGVDGGHNGNPIRPPLMDIEAVAERLSVGVRHVRRLVTEKRVPYRKWGHLLRFEPEEIEEWIDATRVPERHPIAQGVRTRAHGPEPLTNSGPNREGGGGKAQLGPCDRR